MEDWQLDLCIRGSGLYEVECVNDDDCVIQVAEGQDDLHHELRLNGMIVWGIGHKVFYKPDSRYTNRIWCPRLRALL
jgi:hypothetical protein